MNDPTPVADAQGTALDLDFGFRFEDLYDGRPAAPGRGVPRISRRGGCIAPRPPGGRTSRSRRARAEGAFRAARRPRATRRRLRREALRIEDEIRALAARHHDLAPLHSCKRLFVQRRAATKKSSRRSRPRWTDPRDRSAARGGFRGALHGARVREARDGVAEGRARACRGDRARAALRRLGGEDRRGAQAAPPWCPLQGAEQAGPAAPGAGRGRRTRRVSHLSRGRGPPAQS